MAVSGDAAREWLSHAETLLGDADAATREALAQGRLEAVEAAVEAVRLAARAIYAIQDAQRGGAATSDAHAATAAETIGEAQRALRNARALLASR